MCSFYLPIQATGLTDLPWNYAEDHTEWLDALLTTTSRVNAQRSSLDVACYVCTPALEGVRTYFV